MILKKTGKDEANKTDFVSLSLRNSPNLNFIFKNRTNMKEAGKGNKFRRIWSSFCLYKGLDTDLSDNSAVPTDP